MQTYQTEPVYPEDYAEIVEVWEASVRATHHFLSESDIEYFRPLILHEYLKAVELRCIRGEDGRIAAFTGTANGKTEMLFIRPCYRGKGMGKALLQYAILEKQAYEADVNEQNEQAVGFYLHSGFEITGRSEVDGLGKPYPLLHLKIKNKSLSDILNAHA